VLTFTKGKRLTLATPVGRVSGMSPLQVNGTSTPGIDTLHVSSNGAKVSFTLTVTYTR
jgi:hypothetical protein